MTLFAAVDLSLLPVPSVIESLSYETIFNDMLTALKLLDPNFTADTDADPSYKILQICAYRELILRQRVNDAAHATMLAYASGSDLDQVVAREPYSTIRLTIKEADNTAIPPIPAEYESDTDLRRRAQLAPLRYSTAGPSGAYTYFALSADGKVLDAGITSPTPGQVLVTILSRDNNGLASANLLNTVTEALTAKEVRPFTDNVVIQSATIIEYDVDALLTLYEGPDSSVILNNARTRLIAYGEKQHKLGLNVTLSGIHAALHVEGVMRVVVNSPSAELVITETQASKLRNITLTIGGTDA
jgi:phage-related baseplate assembly protein